MTATPAKKARRGSVLSKVKKPGEWAEAEAGAWFDFVTSTLRSAWAEFHTPEGEPFSVDGKVTPKAMAFFEGYCAGLQSGEEEEEGELTNGEEGFDKG